MRFTEFSVSQHLFRSFPIKFCLIILCFLFSSSYNPVLMMRRSVKRIHFQICLVVNIYTCLAPLGMTIASPSLISYSFPSIMHILRPSLFKIRIGLANSTTLTRYPLLSPRYPFLSPAIPYYSLLLA